MSLETSRALRDAVRRLVLAHGALDIVRRPCGTKLPPAQAYALLALRDGPMNVNALASHLNIDRTNVSRLAVRMEATGQIERRVDPDDARSRRLMLTDQGRALADTVDVASCEHFARVCSEIPQVDAVLDALNALTHAMEVIR